MFRLVSMSTFMALLIAMSISAQNAEFYDSVLKSPKKEGATRLISLRIVSTKHSGNALIENGDLFTYLRRVEGVDETTYRNYVVNLLEKNIPLRVDSARPEYSLFTTFSELPAIDYLAHMKTLDILKKFFVDRRYNSDLILNGGKHDEMFHVADVLFRRSVVIYWDDTGGVIGIICSNKNQTIK